MATVRKNDILVAGLSTIVFNDAQGKSTTKMRFHVTSILGPQLGLWVTSPGSFKGEVFKLANVVHTSQDAAKALLAQYDHWTKAERAFLESKSVEKVVVPAAPKKAATKGKETNVKVTAPVKKLNDADAAKVKAANLAKLKESFAAKKNAPTAPVAPAAPKTENVPA